VVKTSFQVLAPSPGTIAEIVVAKGDTFPAGATLARLEAER
jgi:biotin carboxyl carrier protein